MISSGRTTTSTRFRRADARPSRDSDNQRTYNYKNDHISHFGGSSRDMALRGDSLRQISDKGVRKGLITLSDMSDSVKLQSFFVELAKKVASKVELAQQFVRADATGIFRVEAKEDWVAHRLGYEEDMPSKSRLTFNLLEKQCEMVIETMEGELEVLVSAANLAAHFVNKKRVMAEIARAAAARTSAAPQPSIPAEGSDDGEEGDTLARQFERVPIGTRAVAAAGVAGGPLILIAPGADGAVQPPDDARVDVLALAGGAAEPGGEGDDSEAARSDADSRVGSPEREAADDARRAAQHLSEQFEEIETAVAIAVSAHRHAQVELIKSTAMGKVADIRNKSGLGVFESYADFLRDVWNKTAEFSYQSLLKWLDNAAVQTLTSSHCSPGDTNVLLFVKMIAEWTRRASRTDGLTSGSCRGCAATTPSMARSRRSSSTAQTSRRTP
jgi:hypothetical protein